MGYNRRTKAVLVAEQMLEAIKSGRRLVCGGFCSW